MLWGCRRRGGRQVGAGDGRDPGCLRGRPNWTGRACASELHRSSSPTQPTTCRVSIHRRSACPPHGGRTRPPFTTRPAICSATVGRDPSAQTALHMPSSTTSRPTASGSSNPSSRGFWWSWLRSSSGSRSTGSGAGSVEHPVRRPLKPMASVGQRSGPVPVALLSAPRSELVKRPATAQGCCRTIDCRRRPM